MLPLDQTVENEKLSFLLSLQQQYPTIDIENISVASTDIDKLIEFKILDSVLRNISKVFNAPRLSATGQHFHYKGRDFQLSSSDVKNERSLVFTFMCVNIDEPRIDLFPIDFTLDRPSRYNKIVFMIPNIVKRIDENFLRSLIRGLFDVGYNWLNDSISRAITKAAAETNQALYQFVKVMMPHPKLLEGFWFSVLITQKGSSRPEDVVILNDEAATLSIKLASEVASKMGRSPADIVTEMMTEVVSLEDSVIADVCKEGRPIDINLKTEKYYQESKSFNLTLQAIWGKAVTCYPIVADGEFLLVAFYKPEYKGEITPFITLHKAHLEQLAKQRTDHIRKGLDIMKSIKKKTDASYGGLAELFGRFAGGFVHSAAHGH